MKRIIKYSFLFWVSVLFVACTKDDVYVEEHKGDITITLMSTSLTTKGEKPGEDALNENKINTVHYFLFPVDAGNPGVIDYDVQPSHWGVLQNLNSTNTASVQLKVSEPVFNKVLFPRPYNDCNVYVIVNLPSDVAAQIGTDRSLGNLQGLALQSDFTKDKQEAFVMEGMGKVTVSDRAAENAASGTVAVKRVAAKMTVNVNVLKEVEIDGVKWKSQPGAMKMDFYNGVKNAVVSANPEDVVPSYFNLTGLSFSEANAQSQTLQDSWEYHCRPFYSYPVKWNIGDESEPYFKITLPWTHETTENGSTQWVTKETFYKVILGGEILSHNTWSDLTIKLSAPGNFEDFPEYNVLIPDVGYKVVDWSEATNVEWNDFRIETEILDSRYIVVESSYYNLNNISELKIPVSSSHDCEIVDLSTPAKLNQATVTRPNYKKEDVSTSTITWNAEKWKLELKSDANGTYIEFNHPLNNDITSKDIDFAPYTIRFRVRHKDKPNDFYRDVEITQSPAMMIVAEKNEGGNEVEDTQTPKSDDKGYVFVNNNQLVDWISGSKTNRWDLVRSCEDGGNSNPNMYVISTTVPFENYVLTDPRNTTVTSVSDLGFTNQKGLQLMEDKSGKKLEFYYETKGGDDSHFTMAPKFRIASSYGKCWSNINKADAKRRCAAYQERGYPAGRWRLPTPAEIRFIATLSDYGIIPKLFSDDNNYWTSDGIVKYGTDLQITTATSGAVRCVYDDWYWEQTDTYKVSVDKFTWGDIER